MKKMICSTLAYLMLMVPIIAQQPDACMQATIDAENKVNGNLWLGAGCLFGIFGLGAAYVIEPSVRVSKLMGKDANYVAIYTDCYKEAGKDIQTSKAMTGCLIGTGISLLLLSVTPSSVDDY